MKYLKLTREQKQIIRANNIKRQDYKSGLLFIHEHGKDISIPPRCKFKGTR